MKINIVDQTGKKVSALELNEKVWGIIPNKQAQFDSLLSYNAALRQGTHKVKNRAEVSGGGRKPWKQKGTGNARQGSIRAPQWKGGGVVFGPTTKKNYLLKLNKKVRNLALRSALSAKFQNNNIIIIDQFSFEKPSTKTMLEILTNLKLNNNKTLIINDLLNNNENNIIKSARNLKRTQAISSSSINIYDLLNSNKILLTAQAVKNIEEALG